MSKRFLYRYKIVRLYEEDIWGIFFRKQKKRDLFFKKIGYQLFLEIFRKNSYLVNSTILVWKKKLLFLGRQYTKKNFIYKYHLAVNLKKKSKFFLINKQTIFFKSSLKHLTYFVKGSFILNKKYFFIQNLKSLAVSFLLFIIFTTKRKNKIQNVFTNNKLGFFFKKSCIFLKITAIFNNIFFFNNYCLKLLQPQLNLTSIYTYTNIIKWYQNLQASLFLKNIIKTPAGLISLQTLNYKLTQKNTLYLYLKNLRLNLYFNVFLTKIQFASLRYFKNSQLSKIYQPFFFFDFLQSVKKQNSIWMPLWLYWRIVQKKKKEQARYLRNKNFLKSLKQQKYQQQPIITTIKLKKLKNSKYFSLRSWYKWRVKNKKLFLRLKVKFLLFLQKWKNRQEILNISQFKKYSCNFFKPQEILGVNTLSLTKKKKNELLLSSYKKVVGPHKKINSTESPNKRTMVFTQKRFFTIPTNYNYFKQNKIRSETQRILRTETKTKEQNFSRVNQNFQQKEQIFIIEDPHNLNKNNKRKFLKIFNKANAEKEKAYFAHRQNKQSFARALKKNTFLLEPKIFKIDVGNFSVVKQGGFFGGFLVRNKNKKISSHINSAAKFLRWKKKKKIVWQYFLSHIKIRQKFLYLNRFNTYIQFFNEWSFIKRFSKKKYNVCSVQKKFRPQKYSSLSWHFCLLFQNNKNNKLFSTFRYYWKTHKIFNYLKKFSLKSKFKFLLYFFFRYHAIDCVSINQKSMCVKIFFLQKSLNKYFTVHKQNILIWSTIIAKKFVYNFNYNIFLNFYITYIMSKKQQAKYFSLLPFVRNTLLCCNNLLYRNPTKEVANVTNVNFEYMPRNIILFEFIKTTFLKTYKIYFYLFYLFWFIFNGQLVYFKYLKLWQGGVKLNIALNILKSLYFNKIFAHFSNIFVKTNNLTRNILPIFYTNSLTLLDCVFFFNDWFLNYLAILYANSVGLQKFKLYMGIKKSKQQFLSNKKSEYLLLKKLLEFFCLKKKSEVWSKYNLFFKKWIHTVAYAQKKIRRLLYAVRIFFYQKYNKVPVSDSIFNVTAEDLINAVKNKKLLNADNAKKDTFPLKDFIKFFVKNKSLKTRKKLALKEFYCTEQIQFKKTEYLLSFYASNQMFKYFNKLRRKYLSFFAKKKQLFLQKNNKNIMLVSEYNPIFKFSLLKKYSIFLFRKILQIKKRIKFFSLRKRKTLLDKMFTLDLIPVVKYVKKKTTFNSFYKYRMLKIWKFRKFYGCLTNYELNSICLKAYKFRGDIILRFIILLEGRVDTILYRCGLVTSMFEARQLINHGNFLINNVAVKKRSYVLQVKDILSIEADKITLFKTKLLLRLQKEGLLFWPPVYLEVNYKYILVMFIHELLQINQIPFNFKLTGKDLNSILYYYY